MPRKDFRWPGFFSRDRFEHERMIGHIAFFLRRTEADFRESRLGSSLIKQDQPRAVCVATMRWDLGPSERTSEAEVRSNPEISSAKMGFEK